MREEEEREKDREEEREDEEQEEEEEDKEEEDKEEGHGEAVFPSTLSLSLSFFLTLSFPPLLNIFMGKKLVMSNIQPIAVLFLLHLHSDSVRPERLTRHGSVRSSHLPV